MESLSNPSLGDPFPTTSDTFSDVRYEVDTDKIFIDGPNLAPVSLKPTITDKLVRLHRRMTMDIILSAATNVLVYALIVTLCILLPVATRRGLNTEEVTALVLLACCAVPAYGFVCVREGLRRKSVIAHFLRNQITQEEIQKQLFDRIRAAPELLFSIKLKRGAVSKESADHWTRTDRCTSRTISYTSWEDCSASVRDLQWPETGPAWIIVAKDYSARNKTANSAIWTDVATFKKEAGFDEYMYFMEAELHLGLEGMKATGDWELYFVRNNKPFWANLTLYRIMCLTSTDIIFRLIFICSTRAMGNYLLKKFIEK